MILHSSSMAKPVLNFQAKESVLKPSLSVNIQELSGAQPSQVTMTQKAANGDEMSEQSNANPQAGKLVASDLASQMQASATKASQLLKSLSHPDRLLLLCQLTQGEYCVGELESLVGVGQPSLSQQLGILRKDKLVTTRREGKQIYYSIASDDALAVLQLLYERFCGSKGALADS